MTEYHPPPLRAVVAALAIASLVMMSFVGAFFWEDWANSKSRFFFDYHCKRLAAFNSTDNAGERRRLKVVAVGTSILGRATYYDSEMDAYAGSLGLPLSYLRITEPHGGTLDWRPLFDQIIASGPNVILIENYYLFYSWNAYNGLLTQLQNYFKTQVNRTCRLKSWGIDYAEVSDSLRGYEEARPTKQPIAEKNTTRRIVMGEMQAFGLRPGYREILEVCHQRGIAIVVLDMPLAPAVTKGEENLRIMNDTLAELEGEGLLKRLNGPEDISQGDFFDLMHMNDSGQRKYSGWLVKRLQEMQKP